MYYNLRKSRQEYLAEFLELPNGIPEIHNTGKQRKCLYIILFYKIFILCGYPVSCPFHKFPYITNWIWDNYYSYLVLVWIDRRTVEIKSDSLSFEQYSYALSGCPFIRHSKYCDAKYSEL